MRALVSIVIVLSATSAAAQVGFLGVGAGVTWELHADAAPGSDFHRGEAASPLVVIGANLSSDTLVRLQARDLSRTTLVGGAPWEGRMRAYTIGADYLLPGTFGEAAFSGGIGAYRLDLDGEGGVDDVETSEFGWYVAVGEWFRITSGGRLIGEIVMDRTGHPGTPTLITASVILAFQF